MKYLILIYHNERSAQIWKGLSDADVARGFAAYAALTDDLVASGEMIVSEALMDPPHTKHISVRDGVAMATDGPFAEVKEHLAGFYLIECDSIERAITYAGRVPEAAHDLVEVRPIRGPEDYFGRGSKA